MNRQKIIEKFQIPDAGQDILDQFLNKSECYFIEHWCGSDTFNVNSVHDFFCNESGNPDQEWEKPGCDDDRWTQLFIQNCYERGVFNRLEAEDFYCLGNFYGRLDIFATCEYSEYNKLTRNKRQELDNWYFDAYAETLGTSSSRPTLDEVLPLDEVLKVIDQKVETPYLAVCDCKSLAQNCDKPVETCITYRTAANSFVSRRHTKRLTKEEAKAIVAKADKAGLIHTVNPGGICNCCTDCCYLFRASRRRNSGGIWPKISYHVSLDKDICIGCGSCREFCNFHVLSIDEAADSKTVRMQDIQNCIGCGLCVTHCPVEALRLEKR